MKKIWRFVGILTVLLVLATCFTSCGSLFSGKSKKSSSSSGSGAPSSVKTGKDLTFNFSGAKALASTDDSSSRSAGRASKAANDLLLRILEDGSTKAAMGFASSMDEWERQNLTISQIAISPVETADEIYLVINNGYGNYGKIGGLLCVYSDGSYVDILNQKCFGDADLNLYECSRSDSYIKFDGLGNMYFQTSSWSGNSNTTMIYKYDPVAGTITQLTPEVQGTYYDEFIVSDDGKWIFAYANRWSGSSSTCYLRAIPVNDAENFINICYSSSGSGWYDDFIYDSSSKTFYFTGYNGNNSGLFSIKEKNGTFNSTDLKYFNSWVEYDYLSASIIGSYQNNTYKWGDQYCFDDGSVDAEYILETFFNCCKAGEKEFRLDYFENNQTYGDLYTEKKDEEAILYLSESSERLELLQRYLGGWYEGDSGCKSFITHTCFFKGTNDTAVKNEEFTNYSTDWYYSNINAMAMTSEGIYGFMEGYRWVNGQDSRPKAFVRIVDENGRVAPRQVQNSADYYASEVQTSDDLFIFKNSLLDTAGQEAGYHNLQLFNARTGTFTNLFQNVPGSNIEIVSFSYGDGYVYFTGVKGFSIITGKIDINTLAYVPISTSKKMNQIITITH